MNKIRVVVADDHPIVRLGICNVLHKESDIEVVGEAANGSQAVQLVETLRAATCSKTTPSNMWSAPCAPWPRARRV